LLLPVMRGASILSSPVIDSLLFDRLVLAEQLGYFLE
jgi:hypothetical protein